MPKLMKALLIIVLTLNLGLGNSLPAIGGVFDAYKQSYADSKWHLRLNAFIDACSAAYGELSGGLVSLANLVNNWAIQDNILTMIPVACTYSDADTFTLPGDYTSRFTAGKVVQIHVAAGMVYSTVASSSYAAPTTTVNLNDAVLTDPITRVYVVATRDGLWPNGAGYVVALDYCAGAVPTRLGLEAADAVADAAGIELRITAAFPIDLDVTLTSPKVKVQPGVPFAISTTKTLTINGDLDAGNYQIFSCAGTGKVAFGATAAGDINPFWWGAVADGATDCTAAFNAASIAAVSAHLNMVIPPTNSYYKTTGTIYWGSDGITDKGSTLTAWGAKIVQASGTGPVLLVTKYDTATGAFLTGNVNSRNNYANIQGGWWQQSTAGESVVILRASNKAQSYFEKINGTDRTVAGSYGIRVEGTYDDGIAYNYSGGYYNNIGFGQINSVYTGISVKGSSNSNTFYGGSIQSITNGIEVSNDSGSLYRPDMLNFNGIAIEYCAPGGTGVYCNSQGGGIVFYNLRLELDDATVKAIDTAYAGTSCQFIGCTQSGASTLALGSSNSQIGCSFASAAYNDGWTKMSFYQKARRFYSLGDTGTLADIPATIYVKGNVSQVDDLFRITGNDGIESLRILAGGHYRKLFTPAKVATNGEYDGEVIEGTAGENLTRGQVVYLKSDGKYWKAKGDAAATMPAIGLVTNTTVATDATGLFLLRGLFRYSIWTFATPGEQLYVSGATAGLITSTKPVGSGKQVQVVGWVTTSEDNIFFNPDGHVLVLP